MVIGANHSLHYSWRKKLASSGEQVATEFLASMGYLIIARNWRLNRLGEIDIIASDPSNILVFTEVKTRVAPMGNTGGIYQAGFEAVGLNKQKKIMRSAWRFKHAAGIQAPMRFDVIIVIYPAEIYACYDRSRYSKKPEIIHVSNAFAPA